MFVSSVEQDQSFCHSAWKNAVPRSEPEDVRYIDLPFRARGDLTNHAYQRDPADLQSSLVIQMPANHAKQNKLSYTTGALRPAWSLSRSHLGSGRGLPGHWLQGVMTLGVCLLGAPAKGGLGGGLGVPNGAGTGPLGGGANVIGRAGRGRLGGGPAPA